MQESPPRVSIEGNHSTHNVVAVTKVKEHVNPASASALDTNRQANIKIDNIEETANNIVHCSGPQPIVQKLNYENSAQNDIKLPISYRTTKEADVLLSHETTCKCTDLSKWNGQPYLFPKNTLLLGYCSVTKCDASTQTTTELFERQVECPRYGHTRENVRYVQSIDADAAKERQSPPLPHYSSNIYQTVASNKPCNAPKFGRNRFLVDVKPTSNSDIGVKPMETVEKYMHSHPSRKPFKRPVASPTVSECVFDNNVPSYSTNSYTRQFYKQTPEANIHVNQCNYNEKQPFSFGGSSGRNHLKTINNISTMKELPSNLMLSTEICEHGKCERSRRWPKAEKVVKNCLNEAKGVSEFHQNCTTPITVRIIQRLEKEKQKRLSPISCKRGPTKKYPISPKYKKPRTYVSAFHRRIHSTTYNTYNTGWQ